MALRSAADRVEAFLDNYGPHSGAPNRLLTAAQGLYLTQKDLRELIELARARPPAGLVARVRRFADLWAKGSASKWIAGARSTSSAPSVRLTTADLRELIGDPVPKAVRRG